MDHNPPAQEGEARERDWRVSENQQRRDGVVDRRYDYVVCGAGTAGSVVAGRLSEDPSITVLLLEAGGSDAVDAVMQANLWPTNIGTERDWQFTAEPDPNLGNRALPMSLGKVLGGGSSINLMVWARGHRADWDHYAAEAQDPAWNYDSVLRVYRKAEDWQGPDDDRRRGSGGPIFVAPVQNASADAEVFLRGAATSLGVPTFDTPNSQMMESPGGTAPSDLLIRGDQRVSIFRSYTHAAADRPNLTVLTGAMVQRVRIADGRASGVEFHHRGSQYVVDVDAEVILTLGAVGTPKVLMQSGVGDAAHLRSHGVPVLADLPGVGRNFQDHIGIPCSWEWSRPIPVDYRCLGALYWPAAAGASVPDFFGAFGFGVAFGSAEVLARFQPPANIAGVFAAVSHPKSRGSVLLTGPDPGDPVRIVANALSHPDDLALAKSGIEQLRGLANGPLGEYLGREVMPTDLNDAEMDTYLRQAAVTFWHQSGTAKMGTDADSVVDSRLRVHGIEGLRIGGAPVLPRLPAGNTMAPCVVIGERLSELLLEKPAGAATAAARSI